MNGDELRRFLREQVVMVCVPDRLPGPPPVSLDDVIAQYEDVLKEADDE